MRAGYPRAAPGQIVGLLGGSFDPPHAGHRHITHEAIKRFGLERVWWLVSPGNPLKPKQPAPLALRLAAARDLMSHPRVEVTDIEARIGTRYTAETLSALRALYPGVRFVWLMGADNLAQFHLWERWTDIMHNVPVGVIARQDAGVSARLSGPAQRFGQRRLRPDQSRLLAWHRPPVWCFVNVPMRDISSTAIRAGGGWAG
jgi:nicotinate-nucleotide adenylyltransferase